MKSNKLTQIASHPAYQEKIPVYRGKIPRLYWDQIFLLSEEGKTSNQIVQYLSDTYQQDYSDDSLRTVLRYVRLEKRRALDDTLVQTVQQETTKNLERLEASFLAMQSLVNQAIAKGDPKLAGYLQDRVTKLLDIKLSMLKDTRDKNKGVQEQDTPEDLDQLKQDVMRKLNLKVKKNK